MTKATGTISTMTSPGLYKDFSKCYYQKGLPAVELIGLPNWSSFESTLKA